MFLPASLINTTSNTEVDQYCNSKVDFNAITQDLFAMERKLANSLNQWEKEANLIRDKQSQATSLALQLNHLTTFFLLIFLELDLLNTHEVQ